ncbi:MAG: 4-carboxymuconolactone decarboxylase [Gammaproteobacteria bacterium RIFCSPHIGHO2_12_FULL_37_34]|nr:MAG: 4-carboxymuconolactone decarboxylase [Gammaproteobacteria bacterium RIFCSPHIGHO2_12_FULL_37_34]
MNSERLERGSKKINELMKDADQGVLKGLGKTAPDLANYVLEFIFGDLYSRPGLELKTKQMLTITILATLGNAKPQLAYHINCGLNIGITRQEIVDILTHVSGYAGFPAALNGIATAKEVFADRDQKGVSDT